MVKIQTSEDYQSIFDNAVEGIFQSTLEGRFIKVNPAMARIYGYGSPEEMVASITDIAKQIYLKKQARTEFIKALKQKERIEGYTDQNRRKDGSIFWVRTNARIVRDENGNALYIEGFLTDITSSMESQAIIATNEQRFKSIFHSSPIAICLTTLKEGRYIDANKAYWNLTGFTPEDTIGKTSFEKGVWINSKDRDRFRNHLQKKKSILNKEYKFTNVSGEQKITFAFYELVQVGGDASILSMFYDMSEQFATQQALVESEERYRKLVENSPEAIVVQVDGKIVFVNPAAMELIGATSADQLLGKPAHEFTHPDSKESVIQMIGAAMNSGNIQPRIEEKLVRLDGSVIDIEAISQSIIYNGDRATQTFVRDVTKRKQAESVLQRQLLELTILQDVATAASTTNSEDELIQRVTDIIGDTLYPDNCGVELVNKNRDALLPHPSYRGAAQDVDRQLMPLSAGVTGKVVRTGQTIRLGDVSQEPVYVDATPGVKSELCVPIKVHENIIGVLNVESIETDAFTEADARLLNTIAGTLATAIERLRLFENEKRRLKELTTLNAVAMASTEAQSLDDLISKVTRIIGETFYPDNFGVLLLSKTDQKLHPHPSYRGVRSENQLDTVQLNQGVSGHVAAKKKPLRVADVSKTKYYIEVTPKIRSELCVPILLGDQVLGVINAESTADDMFSEHDERLLITIAGTLATTIERLRLFEAEQKRRHDAETLREATTTLTLNLNLRTLLDAMLNNLSKIVSYDSASIAIKMDGDLRIIAGRGFPEEYSVIGNSLKNAKLWNILNLKRRSVIVADARSDPEFEQWEGSDYIRGWMGVSMVVKNKIIGYIFIDSRTPDLYTANDATLVETFANSAAATIENARLFERNEKQIRQLTVLRDIDTAISSSFDLNLSLNTLAGHAVKELKVDAAAILLYDSDTHTLSNYTSTGIIDRHYTSRLLMHMDEVLAKFAIQERKLVHIMNLETSQEYTNFLYPKNEGFTNYFAMPLIGKGKIKGVLELFAIRKFEPDQDWKNFLHTIAGQSAIAIDNIQLFKDLQRSNQELTLAYDTTLEGWGRALELRDKETQGHTKRVVGMTINLAELMNIRGNSLTHIMRGALLHDIGKMGIPDRILHKPGPLTAEEWNIMRKHPNYAYDLIYPIPYLRPALDIPYGHHERWDGSGYPQGLRGEGIPLAARIFAVVDIWDALLHDRPYRTAWPTEKVLQYLRDTAGKELDPLIVEKFLGLLQTDL